MQQRGAYPYELTLGVFCLAGVAVVGALALQNPSDATASVDAAPIQQSITVINCFGDAPHYLGATHAGCAAGNCHGQPSGTEPTWHNSGLVFAATDPHAQAYEILFGERSQQMIHRLNDKAATDSESYFATVSERCIACHAAPLPAGLSATSPQGVEILAHGVSCEACHGPASNWLGEHTSANWKATSVAEKQAIGFAPLEDANSLSHACVQCHIGSPGSKGSPAREVTHDLIAAGHPRLDFELAAWRMALPAHWNANSRQQKPGDVVKLWNLGQQAAQVAQLKLATDQQQRSTQETNPAPWPEFAHVECANCHRALQFADFERERAKAPWSIVETSWLGAKANNDQRSALLLQSLTEGTAIQIPAETTTRSLDVAELRDLLVDVDNILDIKTWDRLTAWYYAARVVQRELELAPMAVPPGEVGKEFILDTLLNDLHDLINKQTPSRYATPRIQYHSNTEKSEVVIEGVMGVVDAVMVALKDIEFTAKPVVNEKSSSSP
jgi:Cytochrome c554 and c-prime